MGRAVVIASATEEVQSTANDAPWVDLSPTSETLWFTALGWVEKNREEIVRVMGSLIRSGLTQDEDIQSDSVLLAYETLRKCVSIGRIDLFRTMFFSRLKFKLKDHHRHENRFLSVRIEDPAGPFMGSVDEVKDTRPSPETLLIQNHEDQEESVILDHLFTQVFHPRSGAKISSSAHQGLLRGKKGRVGREFYQALSAMTRRQRKYWSEVLRGRKTTLKPKVEEKVIMRSLAKVQQCLRKSSVVCFVLVGAVCFAPSPSMADKQIVQQPYTYEDVSGTIKYPNSLSTFVLTEKPEGIEKIKRPAGISKPQGFFGHSVSASGIDANLLVKIEKDATDKTLPAVTSQIPEPSASCHPSLVYFGLNQSVPFPEEASELLAEVRGCNRVPFKVIGHTCDLGSRGYNRRLSIQRATSIATLLKTQGYLVDQVEGEGELSPVENDPAKRYRNRRVNIIPNSEVRQ